MKRNQGNTKLKQNESKFKEIKKGRINKNQKNFTSKPFRKLQSQGNTTSKKDKEQNKFQSQKISDVKKSELAAAKEARIKSQKMKRLERTIVVSKKTKKGQPLMKDRINFLLTKIQNSKN